MADEQKTDPQPTPQQQAVAFIVQAINEYGHGMTMPLSMRGDFLNKSQQAINILFPPTPVEVPKAAE